MTRLSLSFLGGFQVHLDGRPLSEFKSAKSRALLAYLAVEAARPHRRETLAGLLWPERTDRDALSNLRYTLANVRKVISDRTAEPPFLLISRDTLQFNRNSDHWLDVADLEIRTSNALAHWPDVSLLDDLKLALSHYRGRFLEGLSVSDAAPFEEWVVLRREQIAHQVTAVLGALVEDLTARGELKKAEVYARQRVTLEPWSEEAQRSLIRILALAGQRNTALHQFQICRRILLEDLGVEPAEETVALCEAIRKGKKVPDEKPSRLGHTESSRQAETFANRWSALPLLPAHPPVVSRESEFGRLSAALKNALDGRGHVLFITGEAGSGKTVLLDEFARRAMQGHPDLLVARGSCDAAIGIGDPYLPFREIFQLLTGDIEAQRAGSTLTRDHASRLWAAIPDAVQALVSQGPDLIDIFVPGAALELRLEAFAHRTPTAASLAELLHSRADTRNTRQSLELADICEQATRVLQTLARRQPLCLVLDDLQWADTASVNLLFHLGRRLAASRILVLAAYRPDAIAGPSEAGRHPLKLVVNELQRVSGAAPIDLDACDGTRFIDALLDSEPNHLDADFRAMLLRQTEGHPLFTVELLRGMEAQGSLLRDERGCWTEGPSLHWNNLPTRVEAAIAERIDRLPDSCRTLLAAASIEGQEFTAEAVAGALNTAERDVVQCLSSNLDERHRLVAATSFRRLGTQKISRYRFRHYLFRRYLYEQLDAVQRATLHEAFGNALEALYATAPDELETLASRLARHFEMAGNPMHAAEYCLRAGRRASRLAAHEDALNHLNRGLALLQPLPENPERERMRMELQLATVPPLSYTRGFWSEESSQALERAFAFSRHPDLAGHADLWSVSAAIAYFRLWSAQPEQALEISCDLARQAKASQNELELQWAHSLAGFAYVLQGRFLLGQHHLDQALQLSGSIPRTHDSLLFGINVECMALAWKAVAIWVLGYPNQAAQCLESALSLAQRTNNSITLAHLQSMSSFIFFLCARDHAAARQHVQAVREASNIVPPFSALADSLSGMDGTGNSETEQLLQQMRQGLARYQTTGSGLGRVGQLLLHARSHADAGLTQTGLSILDDALEWMSATGVAGFEAEVRRLRGELLLMDQTTPRDQAIRDAAATFREAIAVARRQEARWWELRATVSLCQLLVNTDLGTEVDKTELEHLLSAIYDSLGEGFDMPDLLEAAMLLQALRRTKAQQNES